MTVTGIKSRTALAESAGRTGIGLFLTLFALLCIFPFFYVLTFSITPYSEYLKNPTSFIPHSPNLDAYRELLNFPLIYSGYRNTIVVTLAGTLLNLFLLLISGYPLSKRDLKGRNFILGLITFTMFFNGGLIPNYYLIRSLHMLNSLWSLFIPTAISAWNLILMKNFIATIPKSLEEAAIIDGANEIGILFRVIIPLSKPAIATFTLFHAVEHWNTFFYAIIYISKRSLWPMMLILREMVVEDSAGMASAANDVGMDDMFISPFTLKMAIIIITIIPILCVYPFLQKFFMKGMLVGGIKG